MRTSAFYARGILFVILFSIALQKLRAQEIHYSFTRSEPGRVKFIGQLKLFDLDCGMADPFRISVGAIGDYFAPKTFSLHAGYNKALWGITNMNARILNNDKNSISRFWSFELGGRLYISDRTATKRLKIVMGGSYNYYYYTEKSAVLEFPCRKIFALRGGMYSSVTPVCSDWNKSNSPLSDKTPAVQTTDGKIFGGLNSVYTNMNSFGLYGGLSFIAIINADYSQSGEVSGNFIKRFFRETYIDLLYEPKTSFDAIMAGDGTQHQISSNQAGSFKTSQLGFRVGETYLKPKNGAASFGLELGMRPGISGRGLYFASRIGITITNRNRGAAKHSGHSNEAGHAAHG